MRQDAEGGLSVRMCQIIISFDSLFKDLVPDCFSDEEWLDLFLAMPLVEEYLVGEFRDILKKSDDTIKDDYIEELIEKMNAFFSTHTE